MLSGLDLKIVGLDHRHGETFCMECATRKLGVRAARIAGGLDSGEGDGDRYYPEWTICLVYHANERATDEGYECKCGEKLGEFCEDCAVSLCSECGKRLDEVEVMA